MRGQKHQRVLVTGASGFIGRALCERLSADGHIVVPAVRRPAGLANELSLGDFAASTDWRNALPGCQAVVHLAARVHTGGDPSAFQATNTEATLALARQAADAGVRRFVFVSSVKVHGEGRETAYKESDTPAPEDDYARSKWAAEQGLHALACDTGLEVVILRPPLVYGPGVKANFRQLMRAVERGWPLPLGAIHNRRSVLYLGNLVDAIQLCIEHPDAAGHTFLLDDGEAISTPQLVRAVAHAMDRPARLLSVPVGLLELAGTLLGKRSAVTRLTASLFVDSSLIRTRLGWVPPYSTTAGLAVTVTSAA